MPFFCTMQSPLLSQFTKEAKMFLGDLLRNDEALEDFIAGALVVVPEASHCRSMVGIAPTEGGETHGLNSCFRFILRNDNKPVVFGKTTHARPFVECLGFRAQRTKQNSPNNNGGKAKLWHQ